MINLNQIIVDLMKLDPEYSDAEVKFICQNCENEDTYNAAYGCKNINTGKKRVVIILQKD